MGVGAYGTSGFAPLVLFLVMSEDFKSTVSVPDDQINLARASLLIARDAFPDLDVQSYLKQLDAWAEIIRPAIDSPLQPMSIETLNDFLFDQLRFKGNDQDYSNPDNSYLNIVMKQRLGLPITLSIIYLEIGWRLGLPLSGVSMPGHFIVRFDTDTTTSFIDPFHRGDVLSESDCARLVEQIVGGRVAFGREFLAPASRRNILTRVLNNLKLLYIHKQDLATVKLVLERLLDLNPDDADDTRDLGLVLFRLESYRAAISFLEFYFALNPMATDVKEIRRVISIARGKMARWN